MNQTPVYQFPVAEGHDIHDRTLQNDTAQRLEEVLLAIVAAQNSADQALQSGQNTLQQSLTAAQNSLQQAINGVDGRKAELVTGVYQGDGAEQRDITLGFAPKALLIECQHGERSCGGFPYIYGGLALPSHGLSRGSDKAAEVIANGFRLYGSGKVNSNNLTYFYLAVR